MVVPSFLQEEYPFTPKLYTLKSGHKISYIDEGEGFPFIMLHGNPTWSFYYRNLIKRFKSSMRVIAIDNIGMGFSDRPEKYEYTLESHINNALELIESLGIKKANFIVHDWGGAIGFGIVTRRPELLNQIYAMNTAAYNSTKIPFRISICKMPILGEFMVRAFNLFAFPATFMTTVRPLSRAVKKGYLLPYNNYKNRISIAKFVQDIPLSKKHRTYKTLQKIEEGLPQIKDEQVKLIWGEKDFCFTTHFRNRFLDFFPKAESFSYSDAGHYVLEDKIDEIEKIIGERIHEHSR